MKEIIEYLGKEGLQGYITFDNDNFRISKTESGSKDVKRQRPSSLSQEGKKLEKKPTKLRGIPINCKQLNDVVRMYSKMVNIPVKTILERLDQVSGDLTALDNYIQSNDVRLLWTPEEDEILARGGGELEILKRYKGGSIARRKKYLGLA